MKKNITIKVFKFTFFSALSLLFANIGYAQTFLGLQHSNMSGIHQAGLNPANIANDRHRIYINGFTFGAGFNNDYLQLNLPFKVYDIFKSSFQKPAKFENDWFVENLNGKSKNLNLYTQFRTPGMLLKLGDRLSLGFMFKNNFSIQANDVAEPLAQLARYGVDSTKGTTLYSGPNQYQVGKNYNDNKFSVNVNAWGEIAGTIAITAIKQDNFSLKAGFTPKYLIGYATAYTKNNGVQFKLQSADSIYFNQTDISYGYTDPDKLMEMNPQKFLNEKIRGGGFGYDAGISFEYNPSVAKSVTNKKNNYLFRGGISLLDAGSITYSNKIRNVHVTNGNTDKLFVADSTLGNAFSKSEADGMRHLDSVFHTIFTVDTAAKTIHTKMPTTINIQFDYNVLKNFYVGVNWSQDLRGKLISGIRKPSYFMLIPRFESKFVEVSLPIGMMNDYRTGRIGGFLRVGPVFIGTDNLIGQIKTSKFYGADFYFGLSMGIPSSKK